MIFPYDVNRVLRDSKKLAGENKAQAVKIVFILGSIILFYVTDMFLGSLFNTGIGVTIFVDVIILLVIGIFIYRFVIFDEDEKKREFAGADSDSFARYMFVRKDIHMGTAYNGDNIPIFEFMNGATTFVLEMRFGSNNDEKAFITQVCYEKFIHLAAMYNMSFRFIVGPEDFRNSTEFKNHVKEINAIEDKQLAQNVMRIDDAIMSECSQNCDVDIVYFMVNTNSSLQRAELELVAKGVCKIVKEELNAFRSAHFLDALELMEFYRMFYGIAAIDLSMMRTRDLVETNVDYSNIVSLYQLRAESGKSFSSNHEMFYTNERLLNKIEKRRVNG